MKEPQRQTIGEFIYVVTPMSPIKATKLLTKLTGILGQPIGKLVNMKKDSTKSLLEQEVDGAMIGEAIEAMTSKLDESEVENLLTALLIRDGLVSCSKVGEEDYKKLTNIDAHFSQTNLADMFKVARFVLEVNFKTFFKDLVGESGI